MKTIKFDLDGDNRPFIEGLSDYKGSMFHNQYNQCLSLIESYMKGLNPEDELSDYIAKSLDNVNNIFAFDGERGSGKTSCMLSMANMLVNKRHETICADQSDIANTCFVTMPMIDPSFFDADHNVLSLFVARLYSVYQEYENQPGNKYNDSIERNALVSQFIKVQQDLRVMFGDKKAHDGLEYLVNMAASVDIRNDIKNLVKCYLDYIKCPDAVLILMVDDIDIDSAHAREMAEQLRKYFMQPNMIVFVSLKVSQLTSILERDLLLEYNDKEHAKDIVAERVERYLAKLIPAHQRIYMPAPMEYMDAKLEIVNTKKWNLDLVDGIAVNQVIPELIFQKTRFLFYNSKKHVSYIVPRNLRDIRQLLKMLVQMPEYKETGCRDSYNKEMFRQYFFKDWIDINLTQKYKEATIELLKAKEIQTFNIRVLLILNRFYKDKIGTHLLKKEIDSVFSESNKHYNISLGDVLSIIRVIEKTTHNDDDRRFLFFIKSLYSMNLYKAYDSITSSKEEKQVPIDKNVIIEKKDFDLVHNDYEAITGGCLYNSSLDQMMPDRTSAVSMNRGTIKSSNLKDLLSECISNWDECNANGLIALTTLLMLCVHYDETSFLKMGEQSNYRLSDKLVYDNLSTDHTLIFDVGTLFFNLARVEKSLMRFNVYDEGAIFIEKLKESCKAGKMIFYNDIVSLTNEHRIKLNKSPYERWLSFCCFRNMEIMEDMLDTVKETSYTDRNDITKTFYEFLKAVGQYSIKSYDRHIDKNTGEENKPYDINFCFFNIFASIFEDADDPTVIDGIVEKWFTKTVEFKNTDETNNAQEERTGNRIASVVSEEQ